MIIPIHAANPGTLTGEGNWTYLITGESPVLIDAGIGKRSHLDELAAHVPNGPADVIVTHAHEDHATGVGPIAERWPQTRFWKMPWPERDGRYPVRWRTLTDGATFSAGGDGVLEIVHTPGHSPDHVAVWHAATRTLFSGDLVVLGGTVVIPASAGGNLADYLKSLERVRALDAGRFMPAHGPMVEHPPSLIRDYLEHRRTREREVLAAIDAGLREVDSITNRIYVGLAPSLVPAARESVLAHLIKLETEGAVYRVDDRWEAAVRDRRG